MGDFECDTHVEPAQGAAGLYHADLSKDWEIWGPNGGYLASVALRAAGREAQIQRPVAFAGHFLTVGRFGPTDAEVEVVRRGRSSESLRVTLTQEGQPIFTALVRTAAEVPGLEHDVARAPDVPPPDALEPVVWQGTYPFWSNFDVRWVKPSADDRKDDEPRAHEPHWLSWQRFHLARGLAAPPERGVPRAEPRRGGLVSPRRPRRRLAARRAALQRRRGRPDGNPRTHLEPRRQAPRDGRRPALLCAASAAALSRAL